MKRGLLTMVMCALCVMTMCAVTFNVTVPSGTKRCYVVGAFNSWAAGDAIEMEPSGTDAFTLTLDDVDETAIAEGYKYLCGQDWMYVEKDASGGEIANRTALGSPDVVASWANVYDPDMVEQRMVVNGYPHTVRVLLPADYETSGVSYPVVYLTGVQARYDNAGSDSDRGDDHFGSASWNIPGMVAEVTDGVPCIFVSIYGFVAEHMPFVHPDFAGSGDSDDYLAGIENVLMPYINDNYRVKVGASHTSIVGADLGGLFSVYAALKRPDLFGQCAAISPLLWSNRDEILSYATSAATPTAGESQRFYISVGAKEPDFMKNDVKALQEAVSARENTAVRYKTFADASHTDVAWGVAFKSIYPYLLSADAADDSDVTVETEFAETVYSIVSAVDSQTLKYDANSTFTYITNFVYDGEEVAAQVAVTEIPASVKTQYYWNVSRSADGTGAYLKSTNGNIGFSSKKSAMTWHRVVVLEDETVKDIAANSTAFRVVVDGSETKMSVVGNYVVSATVSFGATKEFAIYFGSVNSGSKQSALTELISVSDDCATATIEYDFVTNRVTVTEEGTGGGSTDEPGTPDIANTDYSIVSAVDSETLVYDANSQFTYVTNFMYDGSEVPAQVVITEIPASVKTQYYWNVSRSADGTGEYLKASNGNIGFSSKKSATTWHRVAVLGDETVKDVAANSTAFRVKTLSESVTMSVVGDYTVKASVDFAGVDKSFAIHFGSVNSGSDMGAVTETYSVSENCTAADITYDFLTNRVTVVETATGAVEESVVISKFITIPSICREGTDAEVILSLDNAEGCSVTIDVNHNYGASATYTPTSIGTGEWLMDLSDLESGIYHLSLNITTDGVEEKSVATIAVKVLTGESKTKYLVKNPYESIDWSTINQYKSNFHTHTTQSFDANFRVDEVVDKYCAAGYKILALTDHDANPYPWQLFNLYNPAAESRNPEELGMLAIPGNELSKSYQNSWNEVGGSEFNHHNDFFTGRQGMEFGTLRESYAYTEQLGGMQLINHPGQYWNINTEYAAGAKNSPEWHAENFEMFSSLIGLEVYNQGNRRPNDRILWDQILELTMPERVVYGYSCDDSHNQEQMFRNYNWMLMPELTEDALKDAMRYGTHYFSYEYTGSGEGKAPRIESVAVDATACTITLTTDATEVYWISATDIQNNTPSTRKSTIIAVGKEFDYTGFQGRYVRALLVNDYGETCTQPFGFHEDKGMSVDAVYADEVSVSVYPNPASEVVYVKADEPIQMVTVYNLLGGLVMTQEADATSVQLNVSGLVSGHYIVTVATENSVCTEKLVVR